ncbi:tripartite tricarboxylate transporter substrate binding protein [Thermodesulfobacteriota bacterium]
MNRKKELFICLVTFIFTIVAFGPLYAKDYPAKPVTFVITFKVGGAADLEGRTLIKAAEKLLKKTITPINKTGAGGSIGFDFIRTAKADGYTIGWLSASLLTHTNIGNLKSSWQDWGYVCGNLIEATSIAVMADAPWKNFQEFLAHAKKNPGKVVIGNGGTGSFTFLTPIALQEAAGVQFKHIPMGVRRVPSLLAREVDAICVHPPEILALVKAKKIRMLAISSPKRISSYPEVPTFKESGHDVGFYQFRGVILPKQTPMAHIKKLESVFSEASKDKTFHALAEKKGFMPNYMGRDEFMKFVDENNRNIKKIVEKYGLRK